MATGGSACLSQEADYVAFLTLIGEAVERLPLRVLSYCLIPNHFHLVLLPRDDGDLSRWMQWLLTAHVRRYHRHYHGSGHVWQGRFKAFPIQRDEHLLTVMRYVERNPLRATWFDGRRPGAGQASGRSPLMSGRAGWWRLRWIGRVTGSRA